MIIDCEHDGNGNYKAQIPLTKEVLWNRLGISRSKLFAIIDLLKESLPDEFSYVEYQQTFEPHQAFLISYVADLKAQGFRTNQIQIKLSGGLPGEIDNEYSRIRYGATG